MERNARHHVRGAHYHTIQRINLPKLPIGFEEENCYGPGKENCKYFKKPACIGSCKWAEKASAEKMAKNSSLEISAGAAV